jgi:hypothetical protein
MSRSLLDTPAAAGSPANITVVTTPRQLLHALEEAHMDIEIREHLDLTGTVDKLLAYVFPNTRSVRVRDATLPTLGGSPSRGGITLSWLVQPSGCLSCPFGPD